MTIGHQHISAKLHSILAVTIVAVLAFLAATTNANAFVGDPMTTPEAQDLVQSLFTDVTDYPATPTGINPATGSAYTATEVATGVTAAEESAGTVAALPELGTIVMGGLALYTGWRIGSADVSSAKWIYDKITGDTSVTGIGASSPEWDSFCATNQSGPSGLGCASSGFSNADWNAGANVCGSSPSQYGSCWILGGTTIPGDHIFCTTLGIAHGCVHTTTTETGWANQIVATSTATEVDNTATGGSCTGIGYCMLVIRTFQQQQQQVTVTPTTETTYNSANKKVAPVVTFAPTTITINNAERTCGGFLGTTVGTASQEACRAAVDRTVDPSWDRTTPNAPAGGSTQVVSGNVSSTSSFELPEPTADETIDSYVERLRALGYLGDITAVDDTMSYPNGSYAARLLPHSITTVQIGTATPIHIYNTGTGAPSPWPTTATTILVNPATVTSITVGGVPSSYNPLAHGATTTTETGAGATPGSAGFSCNCPSIDMSPLEAITYGSKFPFGVFTWFSSIFGTIPATGTAISFDLNKTANPADGTYNITLSGGSLWVGTIRPIAWPIIEFLFVAGAAAVLAYKILGMGVPDD